MKSINVKYFALFRELAGVESESLQVDVETYADLYSQLAQKYKFTLPLEMIQLAVNDEFSPLHRTIDDGARIVFIPPVAGG